MCVVYVMYVMHVMFVMYVMLCYVMFWYAMLCFEGVWLATTPVRTTTGGAHGPVVDSEAVLRDMVTAGPDFYIYTTNNEYPDPGKHSCTLRFVLVSRHRTLSM